MDTLLKEDITDLFVLVDDLLPGRMGPGRPGLLSRGEMVTLLVWNALTEPQGTVKGVWKWARRNYSAEFPRIPEYSAFADRANACLPELLSVFRKLLVPGERLRFLDSTKVPVCKNHRAERYKVARDACGWGKNWQGYWFGFKLHLAVDGRGRICAATLTPASEFDGHQSKNLTDGATKVAVGDTHYGGAAQTRPLTQKNGTVFLAYPHWKKSRLLMSPWQKKLLDMRAAVECAFDALKEHLGLVTSFPRSLTGYLVHYLRILIAYQLQVA